MSASLFLRLANNFYYRQPFSVIVTSVAAEVRMLNKCIWNLFASLLPLNTLMRSMLLCVVACVFFFLFGFVLVKRKVNPSYQRFTFIHELGAKMTFLCMYISVCLYFKRHWFCT